jgi:hypothetical protein
VKMVQTKIIVGLIIHNSKNAIHYVHTVK